MKSNYLKKSENGSNAKKSIFSVAGMFVIIALCVSSCVDETVTIDQEEYCHDQGKLYCDNNGERCCGRDVPYSDGHGTCYNSNNYCRQSGWACSKCW